MHLGVSENSNEEIEQVIGTIQYIAHETGCSIDLVHHSLKSHSHNSEVHAGDMNAARGASSLIDYWKLGRPYLDGLEFPIVASVATRNLMFVAGDVDMTLSYGVSMPLLRDIKSQIADAICEVTIDNGARNLIINPSKPPFDNPELRRALSLPLDRKAFIDILVEGQGQIGGTMQPPPDGVWGMPPEMLVTLPGYDPDVAKRRAEARAIMEKLGYGPNNRLSITVSTRNTAGYRDPAVIAIDQMKEIYIDAVLEPIETANWFPKVIRKDYTVGANISETAVDDPTRCSTKTTPAGLAAITPVFVTSRSMH
jgi:peptide/nickel transport system substrate-binding protein